MSDSKDGDYASPEESREALEARGTKRNGRLSGAAVAFKAIAIAVVFRPELRYDGKELGTTVSNLLPVLIKETPGADMPDKQMLKNIKHSLRL